MMIEDIIDEAQRATDLPRHLFEDAVTRALSPMILDAIRRQNEKDESAWRENNLTIIENPYDRLPIIPEVKINEKAGTRKVNQNALKKRRKKNKAAGKSRKANRKK